MAEEANTYGGVSIRPITAQWVQTSVKWPYTPEDMVRRFMLANGFFAFHKQDSSSLLAMDRIFHDLKQACVDLTGWDDSRHDAMLKTKIKLKVDRIRTSMLRDGTLCKSDGGFAITSRAFADNQGAGGITTIAQLEVVFRDITTQTQLVLACEWILQRFDIPEIFHELATDYTRQSRRNPWRFIPLASKDDSTLHFLSTAE